MKRLLLALVLLLAVTGQAPAADPVTLLTAVGVSSTQTGGAVGYGMGGQGYTYGTCSIDVTACSTCSILSWAIQAPTDTTLAWVDWCKSATAITAIGEQYVGFVPAGASPTSSGLTIQCARPMPPVLRAQVVWTSGTSASYVVTCRGWK
jgi:hypothetical protein